MKKFFNDKLVDFVIDETVIAKDYSQYIEAVSSMIDHSKHRFVNGYKIVVGVFTDQKYFLLVCFKQWIAEQSNNIFS